MKKVLAIGLILLSAILLHAQDTTGRSRFKVGIEGSADYCGYLYYYDGQLQEGMGFGEQPFVGWTAGIHSAYAMNSHWSLTGGLRFTEHSCGHQWMSLMDASGNNFGDVKITYHMRYIDVPLGLQYNTSADHELMFISNVCITPGYALGEWTKIDYEGSNTYGLTDSQHKSEIPNFRTFMLKAEVCAGIGMNMNNFQFQVLPQARMNLLKATTSSLVDRQYWSTGIEFRVLYNL